MIIFLIKVQCWSKILITLKKVTNNDDIGKHKMRSNLAMYTTRKVNSVGIYF